MSLDKYDLSQTGTYTVKKSLRKIVEESRPYYSGCVAPAQLNSSWQAQAPTSVTPFRQ